MRFKLIIPETLRFADNKPALNVPWYYGFSYRLVTRFASVYYIRLLNLIMRFWHKLYQLLWTGVFWTFYWLARTPIGRKWIERRIHGKNKT
jgi:hypothetical protein